MTVLASVSVGEARWITEPTGRSVNDLRYLRESRHRSRAHAGHEQELCEVARPAIGGACERRVEPPRHDVAGGHRVMGRQAEVWKHRLLGRYDRCALGTWRSLEDANHRVGTSGDQIDLSGARRRRSSIG